MSTSKTPSVEELLDSTRNERLEYVCGELIARPGGTSRHARAHSELIAALSQYSDRTGNGTVLPSWHHRFGASDDIRILIPDLVFLLAPDDQSAPDYAGSASDLMIEIVSPDDRASDLVAKVEFYLQNGAKSVWIVDSEANRIDVYKPGHRHRRVSRSGILTDELLPGFELQLSTLFVEE